MYCVFIFSGQQYGQPGPNQPQQPPAAQTQGNYPQNGPQYGNQTFTGQNQAQGMHSQPAGPQGQGYNGMQGGMGQQGPPGQFVSPNSFGMGQQGAGQVTVPPNQMAYNMYAQRSPMPAGPGSQVRPQMGGTANMSPAPSGNGQMQNPMHPAPAGMNSQMPSGQPAGQPSGQAGFAGYNQNQF